MGWSHESEGPVQPLQGNEVVLCAEGELLRAGGGPDIGFKGIPLAAGGQWGGVAVRRPGRRLLQWSRLDWYREGGGWAQEFTVGGEKGQI